MSSLDFILKNSSKNSYLLDVRCGKGEKAEELFKKNFRGIYFGVDRDSRLIKTAKTEHKKITGAKFFKMDAEKLNFKDNNFDIVLSHHVIEHEQYYSKILSELSRVTKKYLILSMSIKPLMFLPDRIKRDKSGQYMNRYNQSKLFGFLVKRHFKKPKKIFEDWQEVVFVFEKML